MMSKSIKKNLELASRSKFSDEPLSTAEAANSTAAHAHALKSIADEYALISI